jgi:hypothetical protein
VPETIIAKVCTMKVEKQTKIYDKVCPGFYVSISPLGKATFAFKYWDAHQNRQVSVPIGTYDREHLTVDAARAEAFDMKARVGRGEKVAQRVRVANHQQRKVTGVSIGQLINEFVAYIKTPVLKADGEKRPRIESWQNVEGFLEYNVRPVIGTLICSEVTNNDIASIQNAVAARSVSSARQTRGAMNRMFAFAAEAGRSYITASPCMYLPSLDKEYERTRVLSPQEIRTFWWGLDDSNLPCIRSISRTEVRAGDDAALAGSPHRAA